jgi:hypothetical protein
MASNVQFQIIEEGTASHGQPLSSFRTYDGQTTPIETAIPDILFLSHYCAHTIKPPIDSSAQAQAEADALWEPVRDWLLCHPLEEIRAGVEQTDEAGKTALHCACQNTPPSDVIDVFLSAASDVVQKPDNFGWLPIHSASAYGASEQVIQRLAEAFPASKTTVDAKGRTPLHLSLGLNPCSAVVALLSSTGAARCLDDNGMLVSIICDL